MAGLGDAAKEYIAGSVAGVAQVVVGHPFDTVKVILFPPFIRSIFLPS
jgi:solute carrier family 25 carnitine/acylcarnitine transporter 20/29